MIGFLVVVLCALIPSAMSASSSDFVYGSDFVLAGGPIHGPVPLTNCIMPPPVSEGKSSGIGELQSALNQTLLNTIPDPTYNATMMPEDTGDWIDLRGGAIYTPPGSAGKCFNRSVLYYPTTCTASAENNYCLEYIPLFNFTWFVVGAGVCVGSYPEKSVITVDNSIPPPGNLGITLSNQCGVSSFGPTGNATSSLMATIIDPSGNKYALQSMLKPFNASQAAEWQAYLESATLPEGWSHEMVNITTKEDHYPYLVGDNCFIMLALDNLGNQYHMYDYKTPLADTVLKDTFCNVMNNPVGVAGVTLDTEPAGPPSSAARPLAFAALALIAAVQLLLLERFFYLHA